jgi:hypothetical protein
MSNAGTRADRNNSILLLYEIEGAGAGRGNETKQYD